MDDPRRILDSQGTIWVAVQECHQVLLKAFDGSGRRFPIAPQRLNDLSDLELRKFVDDEDVWRRSL